jgi:hypothetical protein
MTRSFDIPSRKRFQRLSLLQTSCSRIGERTAMNEVAVRVARTRLTEVRECSGESEDPFPDLDRPLISAKTR